jgi:hypothetical protein
VFKIKVILTSIKHLKYILNAYQFIDSTNEMNVKSIIIIIIFHYNIQNKCVKINSFHSNTNKFVANIFFLSNVTLYIYYTLNVLMK